MPAITSANVANAIVKLVAVDALAGAGEQPGDGQLGQPGLRTDVGQCRRYGERADSADPGGQQHRGRRARFRRRIRI